MLLRVVAALAVLVSLPAGCSSNRQERPASAHRGAATAYVCPMCQGVRQEEPGRCPRCGIDLVAESAAGQGGQGDHQHPPGAHEDHTPRHGGQLGMQGDLHVELVVHADGRHRVFLSDAVRAPILPARARGASLRFVPASGGEPVEVPLAADGTTGALVVTRPLPATGGDVTVRVEVGTARVAMDFALPAGEAPAPEGSPAAPSSPPEPSEPGPSASSLGGRAHPR